MARVRLEGVRKVYDDGSVAVHGVTLDVGDGEFVVLVGPSGCGKSTTLRMIAGLESVTAGRLSIGDRDVTALPPKERDIAMVFQSYALYPHMTVRENMAFALTLRKRPKAEIDRRVGEAAEILGLTEVLDRTPKALSGGQRQRVAVGRAIVRHPQVFLFDEPLSNLDAKLRVQMRREITALHRRLAATMIYVTHDQVEAMTMGDRIVVMRAGHVQQVDKPLALYARPRNIFVAGFIGSPAMNFIAGTLAQRGDVIAFRSTDGAVELLLPSRGRAAPALDRRTERRVVLGARPEDIALAAEGESRGRPSASFRLDLAEPMGSEIVLHATAGPHTVTARVVPQPLPDLGDTVQLTVDPTKLHFFDPDTEAALADDREGTATAATTSEAQLG